MYKIEKSDFIRELKADKFYGNPVYAKSLLKNELIKSQTNTFFTKGLVRHIVRDDYDHERVEKKRFSENKNSIVFFINDPNFLNLQKKRKKLYPENKDGTREDIILTTDELGKADHTINLIHFWFYRGFKKYNDFEHEINLTGEDYLKKGSNTNFLLETDEILFFFMERKYPIPQVFVKWIDSDVINLFKNNIPSTDIFLIYLNPGDRKINFSIERMQEFVKNNTPRDLKIKDNLESKYCFYEDGSQYRTAFGNERGIFIRSRGLEIIFHLIKKYMECIKNKKLPEPINSSIIYSEVFGEEITNETPIPKYSKKQLEEFDNQIEDLQNKIDNSDNPLSPSLIKRYKKQIEEIKIHIKKNTKPKGKIKYEKGSEEKANKRLMKNINDARTKIGNTCPLFSDHLKTHIKQKRGFVYEPDLDSMNHWRLEPPSK